MNSKKHKLPRRILAMLLAICMFVTMFPSAMFAVEGTGDSGAVANASVGNTENGVTVNKYVSQDKNGDYSLTLEAYASNQLTTEKNTTPLDIVLVLDVSGSMDEEFTDADVVYTPVYKDNLDSSKKYFFKGGNRDYRRVEYRYDLKEWGYYSWQSYGGRQWMAVEPMTSETDSDTDHVQFYERSRIPAQSKMDALKTAVNAFIANVNTNATENDVDHQISIVKFAGNKTDDIGNDGYRDGWYYYNHSQVVKDLTSVSTDASTLYAAVNDLKASGATQADYGMQLAQTVLNSSDRKDAKKVVIMFTDGSPTSENNFEGSVANDAISAAKSLKDNNTTIYTIGVFDGANSNGNSDENRYMNGVSSNYPYATTYWNLGDRVSTDENYYFTAEDATSLDNVFKGIADSVTSGSLEVYPDDKSVLSDTLSQYFDFPASIAGKTDPEDVTVQYIPATGIEDDQYTFGSVREMPEGSVPKVTVGNDGKITITGFNYVDNAISVENGMVTGGGKLVVTLPIELDTVACLTDTEITNGIYPTNVTSEGQQAGLSYKSTEEAGGNDASTLLTQSPTVQIDKSDLNANGTDVTVQVYVDGELKENNQNSFVTIARNPASNFNYFNLVSNSDGTLTYDFDYNTDNGYDCVDLLVTPKSGYVLQAVDYFQSAGKDGGNEVAPSGGEYVIDNVTGVDNGDNIDCKIYLSTKYSVQYWQEETHLTEGDYNDTNTYIAYEQTEITDNRTSPKKGEESAQVGWTNADLKTQINLPELKDAGTGMTEDGWFLGSINGNKQTPSSTIEVADVKSEADDDNVIKFYETTAAANHSITINYVNGDNKDENLGSKNWTQSEGSAYAITLDREGNASENGEVPFIIQYENKQYVFDKFSDSPELTGTVEKEDLTFTAEYLLDEKGPDGEPDGVPDKYQAFVTYKIENGTWKDGSDSQVAIFDLYDFIDNQWVEKEQAPTLGNTIPDTNEVNPNENYIKEGSWEDNKKPESGTTAVDGAVYTYILVAKNASLTVEKTVYSIIHDGNPVENSSDATVGVGDTIIYKITITPAETNNVDITGVEITDTLTVNSNDQNIDLYTDSSCNEENKLEKDAAVTIEKGVPSTFYAKYTVTDGDTTLKNAVRVEYDGKKVEDETPEITVSYPVTLTYNANDGTSNVDAISYQKGDKVTVADNMFTFDGYTFTGWNTAADGSGTDYQPDATFNITADTTLYAQWKENPKYISGIEKNLVDTDEEKKAAQVDPYKIDVNNYDYPVDGVVTIPDGEKVTLLYAITVTGDEGATFTVEDTGASLVAQADKDITENNGKFSGTIPDGDSITFYVSKEFGIGDVNGEGMLVNTATVSGKLEDPENPPTIDEKVPAEPELPTKDEVNALFNVMLDCSVVDSHDTTFENLIDGSYEFGDIKYADGSYTVDMTVRMDDYLQNLNDTKPVHHDVDREEFKTVTLTYKDDGDQAGWTVVGEADPAELTTITFQVKCDGTGGYGINDFTKDIVNGETEKADAVAVIGEDKIDEYVIPENETDTITIPFNGEVTLLYKLTVTGNEKTDASFVVTDEGATFVKAVGDAQITVDPEKAGVFSGTVPAGGSVSFYVSKTFTGEDINDEGELINTALIAGANGDDTDPGIDEITETVPGDEAEPKGTIDVTPANLTIYEGGNGGYDAVVDENGNTVTAENSSSLPHPLFTITGIEDPTQLTFINGDNVWEVVADGNDLYHFEATEDGMDPVRITYTNGDEVITSDTFVPTTDSYVEYQMHIYAGEDAADPSDYSSVTAINGNDRYAVKADGEGILTVRAVDAEDPDTVVSEVVDEAPTTEVVEGTAVAVEPANGTTYTLNNTDVVVDEADSAPSLLFDGIIDDNVANRTEMLEDKVDEALGGADADREYEIKYIDLVDANNGNAWIASREGTDIYWGYPEGTDENTDFQILHFKGLHRDGETSGFNPNDLTAIDVDNPEQLENVTITKTEEGIYFHVTEANFSPYALVWETDNGGSDTPDNPGWTPDGGDDGPDGLNTEDHFSYIVGYAEDYRTGEPTDNEDLWPVKPNNQITRAEVATIFYRLLEDEVRDEYDTTVNDFSDVSADSWYNQTVSTLASMGIVKGYEDGTFRPNAPITRAEFGAIATRFFAETGATYEPGTFSDVTGDEWYANAIQDAVNLGLIGGYEDGTVRPNNNITRAEACAIVNRTLGRVPDADHLLPADEMTTWPDNPSSAWFYADMQEATNGHEYEWITEDGNKIEEWTDILDKDWNDR